MKTKKLFAGMMVVVTIISSLVMPMPSVKAASEPSSSVVSIQKTTPTSVTTTRASSTYGTAKKASYYSKYTKSYRSYNIYLPKGYSTKKKYPVIYMLHGIGGDENSFGSSVTWNPIMKMSGNMMASGQAAQFIVVFPNIRVSTTPETNPISSQNYKYYDAFKDELLNCLMPHIESTYSVATGRNNTAIVGFSMGGRESLYIGISRPDKFGYIAAFCPAPGCLANSMYGVTEAGLFTSKNFKLSDTYKNKTLLMIVKGQKDDVVGDQPALYHRTLSTNGTPHVYYELPYGHDKQVVLNGYYNLIRYAFK